VQLPPRTCSRSENAPGPGCSVAYAPLAAGPAASSLSAAPSLASGLNATRGGRGGRTPGEGGDGGKARKAIVAAAAYDTAAVVHAPAAPLLPRPTVHGTPRVRSMHHGICSRNTMLAETGIPMSTPTFSDPTMSSRSRSTEVHKWPRFRGVSSC
jgi:hypothetical protein